MSRSVKVRKDSIQKVKSAVKRYGYARQKDLADDLGYSLATVSNFLNGKPVDFLYFEEICQKLGQDWQAIAVLDYDDSNSQTKIEEPFVCEPEPDFIYVERPPIESVCYETLLQPGALLRIKASGLMGKTSLMARVLQQLAKRGYRTVPLNLHYADPEDFSSLNKFLKWFCISVGQTLEMPNKLADYWDEQFSTSKVDCKIYWFFSTYYAKLLAAKVKKYKELHKIFSKIFDLIDLGRRFIINCKYPKSIFCLFTVMNRKQNIKILTELLDLKDVKVISHRLHVGIGMI